MKPVGYVDQKIRVIVSRRMGLLAFGLVIAIFVAACSAAPTSSDQPANTPAASEGTATGQGALPGTEEFGLTREQLVTNIEAVESLIAKCMSDAGFEYFAVDYDTVRRGMVADKSVPGVSNEDFIAQYGYGISTLYTGLDPQLSDILTPAKIGLGEQNVRIFNSLSPADQVAYSRTLFGEHSDATFATSIEAEDFSRIGGCTRSAVEQVFTEEQVSVARSNPLDALLEQDPRFIAALKAFSDCIREAGFNYNHPAEIEPDIKSRLDAITEGVPLDALSADALAALTELQGEERALATVATDCEEELLEPVQDQVEKELFGGPQQ